MVYVQIRFVSKLYPGFVISGSKLRLCGKANYTLEEFDFHSVAGFTSATSYNTRGEGFRTIQDRDHFAG